VGFSKAEEQNLVSLLLHCAQLSNGIRQIQCIKQIVPLVKKMDQNSACDPMVKACFDILGETYFSLGAKDPLRKVLASVCVIALLELFFLQFLQKSLLVIEEENRELNNHGNCIVQTQLMHNLQIIIKVSMTLVLKLQENIQGSLWKHRESFVWQSMCSVLKSSTKFLMDATLSQTAWTTAGLAVTLFTKVCMSQLKNYLACECISLLKTVQCRSWFVSSRGTLCMEELLDLVLLFLCHGALAMVEWKSSSMGENGEKLLLDITSVFLSLSSELKESIMTISLSRILAIWTNSAVAALISGSPNLKIKLNGNSAVSCTSSDLLETMFINRKAHFTLRFQEGTCIEQWHDVWVSLLVIFVKGVSADANLGSCSNGGGLGALMACLRTARAHGHLELSNTMSNDFMSTECIKQHCFKTKRRNCVCGKNSTVFMMYNLNSQSPSVKQQILFRWIQESSQVLYKLEQNKTNQELLENSTKGHPMGILQQYRDFMSSVCDRLFEVLFPGLLHPTRFSALNILGTITEIFFCARR
uniref:tRNA (32-2'-O)-methyltransferase regulator THADA-like TPR repeats region domain-containing protein n=1 Tax=Strigops habroptila TaxID=2489341 RepID=A0A672UM45_STRHB